MQQIKKYFSNNLQSKNIAIWSDTVDDQTFYSPLVDDLLSEGACLKIYLPEEAAINNVASNIFFSVDQYDCLVGADALIIASASSEFSEPDFLKIVMAMKRKVIFALPDIFESSAISELGFYYERI